MSGLRSTTTGHQGLLTGEKFGQRLHTQTCHFFVVVLDVYPLLPLPHPRPDLVNHCNEKEGDGPEAQG